MSLHRITRVLGGEVWAGGDRAIVPAPGHSAADRSVSLWLKDGRVIAHGFGGVGWRQVLADLQARGLLDREGRLIGAALPSAGRPPPTASARLQAARDLWAAAGPVTAAPWAVQHLRRRAVDPVATRLDDLRAGRLPVSVFAPDARRRPALVAAVRAKGALTAVEITYLDADGQRSRDLRLPRKCVGLLPAGCAVELHRPGPDMVVAEGVFTALSASDRFHRPAWGLLSAGNLARWTPPPAVRDVVIAADRGQAGETAAERLRGRLCALGLGCTVVLPPPGAGDWNDLARREAGLP